MLNGTAGALVDGSGSADMLHEAFAANGIEPVFIPNDSGTLPERATRAAAMDVEAVVAAGGDGTVACVAQALAGSGKPLGIIPFGTMNLLAKDLDLPVGDPAAAIAIIGRGAIRAIDVAAVNGRVFLCASMLGIPARLARHRESQRGKYQLSLWTRMARAAVRAIVHDAPMRLRLRIDGRLLRLRTSSLTITVNEVDDATGRTFGRSRLDGGELVILAVRRITVRRLLRLVASLVVGGWRHDPALQERHARSFELLSRRRAMRVMNDGEVMLLPPPLRYELRPAALKVYVPSP